jgi:hypothetical protein
MQSGAIQNRLKEDVNSIKEFNFKAHSNEFQISGKSVISNTITSILQQTEIGRAPFLDRDILNGRKEL